MPVATTPSISGPSVLNGKGAAVGGSSTMKKKRVVRRRGRAGHGMDSDEEIEREVGTDSDTDSDSSAGSTSDEDDTDAEPRRARVLTPSKSQSPPPASTAAFFASTGNWSEMVADETANGAADLPVIDFAQLNDHSLAASNHRTRKHKKQQQHQQQPKPATSLPSPPLSVTDDHEHDDEEPVPERAAPQSDSGFVRRAPGQTARQAYQTRLESDPSYVPTVGEFWGHDDRLLDKDLRSLSGWWRGRWQGRGGARGRGMFGMRGRGGFAGRNMYPAQQDGDQSQSQSQPPLPSPPPVEKEWTHDGFEELKKNEDARRQQQQTMRGGWGFRGRGTGMPPMRGRGTFARGAFVGSPVRAPSTLPSGRIWYPMKPELSWTKQHEGFLYTETSMRARRGRGAGIRVRLPGSSHPQVVRPVSRFAHQLSASNPSATSAVSVVGSDYGGQSLVVKLPSHEATKDALSGPKPKPRPAPTPPKVEEVTAQAEELTIDDVFTVRPQLVTAKPIPLPSRRESISQASPSPAVQQKLEQLSAPTQSDPTRWLQTEEAVLRQPSSSTSTSETETRPSLAPLQTTFTPPAQYMSMTPSPYQYNVALPPGIAMNPMGMTFEVATGRPVYVQQQGMYPPQHQHQHSLPHQHQHQLSHPHQHQLSHQHQHQQMLPPPFVPGHMRHHSTASGEFQPQPQAQYPLHQGMGMGMGYVDPTTGMPLFSFAQPSSRVQIRPPGEGEGKERGKGKGVPGTPGLRSSAVAFEPTRAQSQSQSQSQPEHDQHQHQEDQQHPHEQEEQGQEQVYLGEDDQGMMYAPYGHGHGHGGQYYYPGPGLEAYGPGGYGAVPYMDVQPPYEMYDPNGMPVPQGTVYY